MKAARLAALCLLTGLMTTNAEADLEPGFVPHEDDLIAVRFRSFGNSGGSEMFLGVPDLGVGGNRTEVNFRWPDGGGDFPFTFTLDRANDLLRVEINGQTLTYPNLTASIAAIKPGSPYTLFDLNLLQVDIAQRDDNSTVELIGLALNGEDLGDLSPESNGFFTWTAANECVAVEEVATLTGTLRLSGPFSRSQEKSRVEFKAGVREADGLNCVTRILNPAPDIFKNGLEPVIPTDVQFANGPGCTTAPWSVETGSVDALGANTVPLGKKYEQDCALTAAGGAPGFVTTEAPFKDKLIATRFYFHGEDLQLNGNDAVIFMARDGATPQVRLALRDVGDAQHLVVSYRSNGLLVEHPETFPTLPVWQAATVTWSAGDGDGALSLMLDDRPQLELNDLSNGDEVVNELDMGLVSAAGTSGAAHFDAFHARRELPAPDLLNIDKVRNFSTRALVGEGRLAAAGGFIIEGDTKKCVVLRGRGPSLDIGNLPRIQDPNLTLVRMEDKAVIDFNDDWSDHPAADKVSLFGRQPGELKDAGKFVCLDPGAYTATLRMGAGETSAKGIVEIIDVDRCSAHLYNISTRAQARTGALRKIGGFIVDGEAPRTVLIRGRGQSVRLPGVTLLDDPVLELRSGQTVIATNDDWQASADAAAITATGKAPTDPTDAAILVTLEPGPYTVSLGSKNLEEGVGIIEVLDLNGPTIEAN